MLLGIDSWGNSKSKFHTSSTNMEVNADSSEGSLNSSKIPPDVRAKAITGLISGCPVFILGCPI